MNFEPQKFFIGLTDFFSVLLPGALLTYATANFLDTKAISSVKGIGEAHGWIIFFISSYLLGHFIFLTGSILDWPYDWLRKVARGIIWDNDTGRTGLKKQLFRIGRVLSQLVFKREDNAAFNGARSIMDRYLAPLDASSAVNPFQWSKLRLAMDKPEAFSAVQRFEADSKFFRSLVVVLLLMLALQTDHVFKYFAVWIALLLLALWRYIELRYKATNQAFWAVISLEAQLLAKVPPEPLTHAGGVVYQQKQDDTIEYLLVAATGDPKELVLPKGHIEFGEVPRETAVREVFEETGVFGSIQAGVDDVAYDFDGKHVRARFYLMKARSQGASLEARSCTWQPIEAAVRLVRHEQSKKLLIKAEQLRPLSQGKTEHVRNDQA